MWGGMLCNGHRHHATIDVHMLYLLIGLLSCIGSLSLNFCIETYNLWLGSICVLCAHTAWTAVIRWQQDFITPLLSPCLCMFFVQRFSYWVCTLQRLCCSQPLFVPLLLLHVCPSLGPCWLGQARHYCSPGNSYSDRHKGRKLSQLVSQAEKNLLHMVYYSA